MQRIIEGIGALVIGGDYRGLGIVRSLGRRGIPVWVITDDHRIANYSRYTRKSLSWKDVDPSEKTQYLIDLATEHNLQGWVIFPTSDDTTALVAKNHEQLKERYQLTTPDWQQLSWFHNKRLAYQLAARAGVDAPWTFCPQNQSEVASLACDYPVILKPALREDSNPLTHEKAWQVENQKELLARYKEACEFLDPELIMIQELIPGDGDTQYSYAALCKNGLPLVSIVALRRRQYPIDFGRFSTFVETVNQPAVERASRCLLLETEYTGLVELEYKYDARSDQYKLLDINPRVWGWHTLGKQVGIDFPYLFWQLLKGEPIPELHSQPGAKWIRWATDIPVALKEVKNKRLPLSDYLSSLRPPLEDATIAPDDPFPAIIEIPSLISLGIKRGRL